jgi:hypothetical protein
MIKLYKTKEGFHYCRCDYTRYKNGYPASGQSAAYVCWNAMKQRCLNPNDKYYYLYGGRGVTICERWLESYDKFFEDMGHPPTGTSLDKDIKGGTKCNIYSPNTCCWATPKEQANAISSNVNLTLNGITQSASEWARQLNIKLSTIYARKRLGHSDEECLSTQKLKGYKTKLLTHNGVTQCISDWATKFGINVATLSYRLRAGYTLEEALAKSFGVEVKAEVNSKDVLNY